MYKSAKLRSTSSSVSEARQAFAEIVNRVAYGNERVVVARRGRALVAIVPMSDMARLEAMSADATPDAGQGSVATPVTKRTRAGNAPRP